MTKTTTLRALSALLASCALGAGATEQKKERDPREFAYLQLAAGTGMSTSGDINIGLGSIVQVPGEARYSQGRLWGVTLGYQFLRGEDDKSKKEREPLRAELELWNAQVTRDAIAVAAETVFPRDKVKPRVLFANVAMPIGQSDELYRSQDPKRPPEPLWRTWIGAGLGLADLSYPSASAISGCNCLRQASGSGLAFQVKLQAERQIGENSYVFAQVGRVWLPSVSTTQGTQSTEYGQWGINNLAVGVRWAFRD